MEQEREERRKEAAKEEEQHIVELKKKKKKKKKKMKKKKKRSKKKGSNKAPSSSTSTTTSKRKRSRNEYEGKTQATSEDGEAEFDFSQLNNDAKEKGEDIMDPSRNSKKRRTNAKRPEAEQVEFLLSILSCVFFMSGCEIVDFQPSRKERK